MSDRAKKSIGQDAVGVLFCLLGGFFLVSIYLSWKGNEPVNAYATKPVLELVALLGPVSAALLALGTAAIGAWIFLAAEPPSVGRPLGALVLGSAGFALILGAFAHGGSLGEVFPGLAEGLVGRLIGAVLGVVVAFFAFTLVAPGRSAPSTADVMRAGLAGRTEVASGVSSAEASLLVGEPRPAARPAPRREEPLREETLRPLAPEKPRVAAPVARPLETPTVRPLGAPVDPTPASELPRPAAPAWEAEEGLANNKPLASPGEVLAEDEEEEAELAAELTEALHTDADETEELEAESFAAPEAEPAPEMRPPAASWEQVGLFDEGEEEDREPVAASAAPATGTLDFDEVARPTHEPERGTAEDPFAAAPVVPPAPAELLESDEVEGEQEEELEEELEAELDEQEQVEEAEEEVTEQDAPEPEPARAVRSQEAAPAPAAKEAPAPAPEFVLQPRAAARPEPKVARDGEGEKWQKLVFDSGLLILEQKRVAVSMLERRFGIDFDQACRVLDELQQVGLIGPYIGGRTREILLTKEQWQAQAAETA